VRPATRLPGDRLWAITCYFNPCGYRRRAANYQVFRQHLQVPLLTVELSFTGALELRQGDADLLIQICAGDVMWQKERLLNVAIESLPATCDRVVWIDCDVVFQDDAWPRAANATLDRHPVIQPFDMSHELRRDVAPGEIDVAHTYITCRSLACGLASGEVKPDIMLSPNKRGLGIAIGLAWAARRELLQRHHLYDACVVGGGPNAITAGIMGNFQDLIDYLHLNARRREHFLAWARPFHDAVRADLGCCAGTIFHLWHGDLADRNYRERRLCFAEFDFDPYSDIAIENGGPWRWNSDKPRMHRFVRDYFASRFEDGRPDAVGAHPVGVTDR
jgi:hypothetical protein